MRQSSWSEVTTKYIDLDDKELCTLSGLHNSERNQRYVPQCQ